MTVLDFGDALYVLGNGTVSITAALLWTVVLVRAKRHHRRYHDGRSLHAVVISLAVLLAAIGTLGPLLVFLSHNLAVLGDLNGLTYTLGRVLAGGGRAAVLVAGISMLLDDDAWRHATHRREDEPWTSETSGGRSR